MLKRLIPVYAKVFEPIASTPPFAEFSADNLTPTPITPVNFTDLSTNGPILSRLWERNNGGGWELFLDSTAQNPQETFPAGTWSVRLTVTNSSGSDTETKTDYIVSV